ncbi:MAG: D-alanyl-D-alanine carboxypeptidase, partial [Syntrophomonadaceae bacterium]
LFNYGFAKYAYKSFFSRGSVCGVVQVGKGIGDSVEVIAEDDVGAIVEKGQEKKITTEKRLQNYVNAPVEKGQKLGEMRVYDDGNLVKEVNLVAASDVPKGGFLKEILKMLAETYLL